MENTGSERKVGEDVEGATKYQLRQLMEVPAVLKSKARPAGEYAALRTRQGISMFGEPRISSSVVVEEGANGGSVRWASVKSKVRAAGEYAALRTRQGISMFGDPKIESAVDAVGDRQG